MLPLVEFPELVQHYAPFFREVFSAEALIEFERYNSGLIVSENKTVDGINRLFVIESCNQNSLTESPYSLEALNQARLALLASLPGTQMKPKGVFSVDDTLLTHYGQDLEPQFLSCKSRDLTMKYIPSYASSNIQLVGHQLLHKIKNPHRFIKRKINPN